MNEQSRPLLSVFRHLQVPVSQRRATVAARVTQRVAGGDDPDAEVDGEPGAFVVVRVAVERRRVATQDVFRFAIRKCLAFR